VRLVIIGGDGQLGSDLKDAFRCAKEHVISLSRNELDITQSSVLPELLSRHHPDVILNCSVYHPVDECENNPEHSFAVNATAVRALALAARDLHAAVVHFSSDYVFDGELGRPYTEDDTPTPVSVFGVSKVAGEQLLRAALPSHFIIRTSGLYGLAGSRVKRGNFVETMLRLGRQNGQVRVVNDLRMAQTSTRNLARQVLSLIRTEHYGTYHASDHGDYSWYEFAMKIFEYSAMEVKITPVSWRDMPAVAPRPRYSVLENGRLKALCIDQMQPIDVALQTYLKSQKVTPATESKTISMATDSGTL
jgi:dTDP-4-dehydrorhamnose reductase